MDLILIFVLLCVMFSVVRQNSRFGKELTALKKAKKELNIKKPTYIKYDMRDLYNIRRTIIVLAIIVVVGGAIGLALYNSSILDGVYQNISKQGFWVLAGCLYGSVVAGLIMTISFFYEGLCYVNGLASHRYYVPDNKKDYCSALEGLPREEPESIIVQKDRNKESLKLALLNLITAFLLAVSTIVYHIKYGMYFKMSWMFFGFLTLFWLLGTIGYYKQSDEKKYRDVFDIELQGKVRKSWGEGVTFYLFYLAVTIFMMILVVAITNVAYEDYMRMSLRY